jgi:hypothetical protein
MIILVMVVYALGCLPESHPKQLTFAGSQPASSTHLTSSFPSRPSETLEL